MTRMADQEREVELLQDLSWHHSRISGFGFSFIGEGCLVVAVDESIGSVCSVCSICSVHFTIHPIRSNSLLDKSFHQVKAR